MSLDYTTYFGPFFVCEFKKEPCILKKKTCPNKACSIHGKYPLSRFCDECGTKIDFIDVESEKSSVNPVDVSDEFRQALFCVPGDSAADLMEKIRQHIYLPNEKRNALRNYDFSPKVDVLIESISHEKIDEEKKQLVSDYEEELKILNKRYDGKVRVSWGVINYIF